MSARRSPVERDAREIAAAALKGAWRRRTADASAYDVFEAARTSHEQSTTWAVQRGDMPAARRQARAAQLLDEAIDRLIARQKRDVAAELAQSGIVPRARVVVVHTGYSQNAAPVGTVLTLEDDIRSTHLFGTDDDGQRWIVYSGHIEVVPDAPADESPMPHGDEYDDRPSEPPLGDQIIASGVFSDSQAFTLSEVSYAAEREGRDPEAAVLDTIRAWDAGEATA